MLKPKTAALGQASHKIVRCSRNDYKERGTLGIGIDDNLVSDSQALRHSPKLGPWLVNSLCIDFPVVGYTEVRFQERMPFELRV